MNLDGGGVLLDIGCENDDDTEGVYQIVCFYRYHF